MAILDILASGQVGGANGATGTVTVPARCVVIGASATSTAGGSVVVTPNGPNQAGTANAKTITIPAGTSWDLPVLMGLGQLGPGSTLVFATTDAYDVWWVKTQIGGP